MQQIQEFINSSQTWTVPNDWSNVNKIEITGGGGGGGQASFLVSDSGGLRLIYYSLGGAGGGYVRVTNLNNLKPGDQIVVTIAAGGGAGTNYGGSGGTTSFGGLFFANGGSVGSGTYAPHYGGGGSINLVNGTYGSLSILPGENKFWTGSNGNPNQSITVPGGAAGGSFSGSGGRGGDAERTNPYVSAKSGQRGAVLISYEPSGTHQACVWIS